MYVIIQLTKEREENNMIDNSEMFAELRNDLRNVIKEQTILMTDEELDIIIPIIQKFRAEKMAKESPCSCRICRYCRNKIYFA